MRYIKSIYLQTFPKIFQKPHISATKLHMGITRSVIWGNQPHYAGHRPDRLVDYHAR